MKCELGSEQWDRAGLHVAERSSGRSSIARDRRLKGTRGLEAMAKPALGRWTERVAQIVRRSQQTLLQSGAGDAAARVAIGLRNVVVLARIDDESGSVSFDDSRRSEHSNDE